MRAIMDLAGNWERTSSLTRRPFVYSYEYVLCAAVLLSLALWAVTGIPLLPIRPWAGPFLLHAGSMVATAILVLLVGRLAVLQFKGRMTRKRARAVVRRHIGAERLLCVARYLISLAVMMTVQSSLKQAIPLLNARTYDPILNGIETFLHGGISPSWVLSAHSRPAVWLFFLDTCYYLWFPFLTLVAVYFMTHVYRARRDRYLTAFLAIWLVGAVIGSVWPSHGPCYVDDSAFPNYEMPFCVVTQQFLRSNYESIGEIVLSGDGGMTFGCGLMAMPSLHVTACALYVIFLWREKWYLRLGSVLYLALIFLGSLYSGWHYAIDGYAGVAIAVVSAWLAHRLHRKCTS